MPLNEEQLRAQQQQHASGDPLLSNARTEADLVQQARDTRGEGFATLLKKSFDDWWENTTLMQRISHPFETFAQSMDRVAERDRIENGGERSTANAALKGLADRIHEAGMSPVKASHGNGIAALYNMVGSYVGESKKDDKNQQAAAVPRSPSASSSASPRSSDGVSSTSPRATDGSAPAGNRDEENQDIANAPAPRR